MHESNTHHSATSATLLGRLAIGDAGPDGWPRFVDRYGPMILALARRAGCPESDLEDVLQNILIKLLKAFSSFRYDPGQSFRAWLATVTRNAVTDYLRSPQARDRGTGDTELQRVLENMPAQDELCAALYGEFERELFEHARAIVQQRVQPKTWQAFALTELEGVAAREAAARLEMPLGGLYVARSRVLALLRAEVNKLKQEIGA